MEPNFFRFVWNYSRRQQTWILIIVLLSFPIYYISLTLPKWIVNGPIQGDWFETTDTVEIFQITSATLGGAAENATVLFEGFELDQSGVLVFLSFAFLAAIAGNGFFRYYINKFKGQLGERMLRRLRYMLVDRLLRFPFAEFKTLRSSEVSSMVKDEVEPLGGFIGDAFVQPVFLVGQALTILIFIVAQNVWLGCIAIAIVALQTVLIPRLRRKLLVLAQRRQLAARRLAGDVGEIVEAMTDIRLNDATNFERATLTEQLGDLFFIRNDIYIYKFLIKYLNNFISQMAPFFFFLVGGLFAISGELDVGQLIAVIAAYKDLPRPIKELIDWDQQRMTAQLAYARVIEQFAPTGMTPPEEQAPAEVDVDAVALPIEVKNLTLLNDSGAILIDGASFTVDAQDQVALVDRSVSGASALASSLLRLTQAQGGDILVGGRPLSTLPETLVGRRFAYVDEAPFFRDGALKDCLLYSLRHARPRAETIAAWTRRHEEAVASGNATMTLDDDWFDLNALGVEDAAALERALRKAIDAVELNDDVFELGLSEPIGPQANAAFAEQILACRDAMRRILAEDESLAEIIERLDPDRYQHQVSIGENLLFGAASDPLALFERLARTEGFWALLREAELDRALVDVGRGMAETIVELFADVPETHPFFERVPFLRPSEIPELARFLEQSHEAEVVTRRRKPIAVAFLKLALHYTEPNHRFGLLEDRLRDLIVRLRPKMRTYVGSAFPGAADFWSEDAAMPTLSVEENILFGRIAADVSGAATQVRAHVARVVEAAAAQDLIIQNGLSFRVGAGGRRLTPRQRQKVALARAVLKRPSVLIVNNGLSALDAPTAERLMERFLAIGREGWRGRGFASLWVLRDETQTHRFDRALRIEDGAVSEIGGDRALAATYGDGPDEPPSPPTADGLSLKTLLRPRWTFLFANEIADTTFRAYRALSARWSSGH